MKENNTKGFSAIEGLLILVIVGLLGFVGWYIWDNRTTTTVSQNTPPSSASTSTPTEAAASKTTPYTFKQLGVTMYLLPGWKVTSNPTKEEGVNFYSWTVSKTGADGKISVNSIGFRGDGQVCEGSGSLTAAIVKDVAATQNTDLTFLSWSYKSDNETVYSIGIVKSDEAVFKATNNASAAAVKNKTVKPGTYYLCISEDIPGDSLGLNKEAATGFVRRDSIRALSKDSTVARPRPLTPTAQSYKDIKTMLTSVK